MAVSYLWLGICSLVLGIILLIIIFVSYNNLKQNRFDEPRAKKPHQKESSIMDKKIEKAISNNKYVNALKELEAVQRDKYCKIKNYLLSFHEIDNYLIADGETFRYKNISVARFAVTESRLSFFLKLSKDEIDQRFNNQEAEIKKYQNTPLAFPLDSEVEVRKAISSIERLAKEYELLEKKEKKNLSFGWLIRF